VDGLWLCFVRGFLGILSSGEGAVPGLLGELECVSYVEGLCGLAGVLVGDPARCCRCDRGYGWWGMC
jgi:hypothetical protein